LKGGLKMNVIKKWRWLFAAAVLVAFSSLASVALAFDFGASFAVVRAVVEPGGS